MLMLAAAGCGATTERVALAPETVGLASSRVPVERQYVVRKGDTLIGIAKRYSVTPIQLQYRNRIMDPRRLQIGTSLAIPDPSLRVPGSFSSRGHGFKWPLDNIDVSSEYGVRGRDRHWGIDLRAPRGTPIRASADGVVLFAGRQGTYGKVVIVQHTYRLSTLYAHNARNLVRKGQRVRQGEVIATVGRTGHASGYHVHFEYIDRGMKLDPRRHVGVDQYVSIR